MKAILVSLALLLAASTTLRAHYHHMIPPIVKAPKPDPISPGGAWCTGGCVWVGGFIAAVAGAIIVHEILGPACAKPGNKNGYDSPTLWRPLCKKQAADDSYIFSK